MQNLTEGRIPAKIARTLGTPEQAARLVKAGLWVENVSENEKEFVFHEWGTRQLSAEQISDRRRKRSEAGRKGGTSRKGGKPEATNEANTQASASANAQASDQAKPKQNGTPVPVPVLSVVTREGNDTLADARNLSDEPPRRCPKHIDHDDPPPCGACAETRRANDTWNLAKRQAEQDRANAAAADRIQASRALAQTIAACDLCDEDGYIGTVICSHNPAQADTNARGMAAVQAAIERGGI
jgi:hypothetical protein